MENQNFTAGNIHQSWLENIFQQIKSIQTMERNTREGCEELMEYLQIPSSYRPIIMPDIQYKNLRFWLLEIDMLLVNIQTIQNIDVDKYKKKINPLIESINQRKLFLKEIYQGAQIIRIEVLPLFYTAVRLLTETKSGIIKDLAPLLYLKEEENKRWK